MRFKKILYHNYRCFLDNIVEFSEDNDRNINILIGPNGGGKTELLFSFWWVLYGYDFTRLTGKEDTPYALNSDLYKNLFQKETGAEEKCFVTLDIDNENITYTITKHAIFRKTPQRVKCDEWQTLSIKSLESSIEVNEQAEIERIIEKILPKSILYGILFDGERMQKLSSPNEIAKNAIKGVISDITNVNLFEKSIVNFKSISSSISKDYKELANKIGASTLETLISEITELETYEKEIQEQLSNNSDKFDKNIARIAAISDELQNITGIKALEKERTSEQEKIDKSEKNLDKLYKDFSEGLHEGYVNLSLGLLSEVESLVQNADIPSGLTMEVIEDILAKNICLCGHEIHENERNTLQQLLSKLPTDNVNSTISEIIKQTRVFNNLSVKNLDRIHSLIESEEMSINESKIKIAELSSKIENYDDEKAKLLEKENNKLREEIGVIKTDNPKLDKQLKQYQTELKEKRKLRDSLGKKQTELNSYTSQLSYIDKCLKALYSIKTENKIKALNEINKKLQSAYSVLSEDSKLGKDIYIIQFDPSRQFQMVVYLKQNYDNLYAEWKRNGKISQLIDSGLSEAEISEQIIIDCIDASSTGQSKMNTLSFVKAILDYSNQKKNKDSFEIKKNYPFLIDAPFGDIAGKNLTNSASELHTFSEQVILMLDTDKYTNIQQYLNPYISKKYIFQKLNKKNHTLIIEMKE